MDCVVVLVVFCLVNIVVFSYFGIGAFAICPLVYCVY